MGLLNEEIFNVRYPVAFRSGGDTTREAFGKHIEEIKKIYGDLRSLNAAAASADGISSSLAKHIADTDPHPNWKPKINFSDITGDLDASKVKGKLTNATIDTDNVNGLKTFVEKLIPATENKGDGITESSLKNSGYIKFNNGLIIQWGNTGAIFEASATGEFSFPQKFSSSCYSVHLTYKADSTAMDDMWCQLISYDASGFKCRRQADDNYSSTSSKASVNYIAIGK